MSTVVQSTITFPYRRSLGPVIGAFMTALTECRLIGIASADRVIVPPLEWDPESGETLPLEFVDVGPAGTVETWCWVTQPSIQHPLGHPFAMALIRLDGADTALLHAVDAGSVDQMSTGMRVAPRWRAERKGHITDIEAFVPGEDPIIPDGGSDPPDEPVTMMDYAASITYTIPVTPQDLRVERANAEGRFLGLRCPLCLRTYTAGNGFCPVDSIELGTDDEVDLPQRGTITNYTIITPVQYPGQTETEPFSRVHVWLDDTEVVLGYQPMLDTPNSDIHIGLRVAAVWASAGEKGDTGVYAEGNLLGWMPTGEADVDDPDLVNRIH